MKALSSDEKMGYEKRADWKTLSSFTAEMQNATNRDGTTRRIISFDKKRKKPWSTRGRLPGLQSFSDFSSSSPISRQTDILSLGLANCIAPHDQSSCGLVSLVVAQAHPISRKRDMAETLSVLVRPPS